MNEPRTPVLIRIPAGLKARISDLAKREHRSTNQEIEFLLERALGQLGENLDQARTPGKKRKYKQDATRQKDG